jgi:D-lactate dehydrogenase (cytochrome)
MEQTGIRRVIGIEALRAIVGPTHVLTGQGEVAPYATDWRKRYSGAPLAVAKPGSVGEVVALVKLCAATKTAIVPQGGNTSLCGASVPDSSGEQLVINLSRLNRIRHLDPLNNTMTVEAGCVLAAIQEAALAAERLFPLSLAAQGSCEIGGNLSTNAGGVQVLRYGTARDLVLGLEVVLPSGELWDGLRGLRKDNTGYDLKQLFIGAEGTLGIITAAVLKLYPKPRGRAMAFVGLDSVDTVLRLLALAQATAGERVTAFELMSGACLDMVLRNCASSVRPFAASHPQYALIELTDTLSDKAVGPLLESLLQDAIGHGIARDAVVAQTESQARALWALRENMSEAQSIEGKNLKFDVSVPVSALAKFVEATDALLEAAYPGMRPVTFGHVGDGNLHYNIAHPPSSTEEAWLGELERVNRIVHDSVARHRGSISAEHGIGQSKRLELPRYKSEVEMNLMRAIKQTLDPLGIMNPGKLL